MVVWLAGAVALLARLLVALWALRRTIARARAAQDEALLGPAREAAQALGLRRMPRLLLTDEPVTPFVCGVLRPTVVLPAELARGMPPDELHAVLAHEFAHVRRRDSLLGWLPALCEVTAFSMPSRTSLADLRIIVAHISIRRSSPNISSSGPVVSMIPSV